MDVSGVPRWLWLKAEKVAEAGLADWERGKAISVPSLRYKALTMLARHAPSGLTKKLAQRGR
jgi:hypothetical protein